MSHGPDTGPPRVRRGAHRTRRSLVSALMPSVLAVAAVSALVTSLAVWQGDRTDSPRTDTAAAATAPATSPRTTSAPATSSPAAASAPPSSASPESAVEGTKAERTPQAEKTPSAESSAGVDRSSVEVVVLNQTSRPGLAASVAAHLRTAGWDVPAVGNFRGTVPATTVYYPAGGEAVALAVARDLRAPPRTLPRFGNLSTTRFTVVVTDSYRG
jgi:hypothetical protein